MFKFMLGATTCSHYVAKYICGKKFNNYSWDEERLIEPYGVENLEKEMRKKIRRVVCRRYDKTSKRNRIK